MGEIRLDDLNWEQGGYKPWRAYGQSKLANLLFTSSCSAGSTDAGSDVRAVAAHPGYAATNLQSHTATSSSTRHVDRQQADRPERRAGRVADAVRGDAGHRRRLLRRPRRLPGGPRPPDARRPQRGGQRRRRRAQAVGALRAADRASASRWSPPPPENIWWCSSCARPASAAPRLCRRTRRMRASARTSARSAPIASMGRSAGVCPNCGGNFERRPIRPPAALAKDPASTVRVFNPQGCQVKV